MQDEWADEDVFSDPEGDEEQAKVGGEEEEEKDALDEAEMSNGSKSNALVEFRVKVEEAILANSLIVRENNSVPDISNFVRDDKNLKDIKLWGVPLLPSAGHDGTDVVLAKFLKAKHYKVHKAFSLLQETLKWRADFWFDEDDSRPEMDDQWFISGRDKQGRPLFYTVLGKEARKRFMNTKDQNRYLDYFRWRIQCVETGIRSLDFSPGGVDSFIQIIDFKNSPGIVNREIKLTYRKMLTLLRENYPGLVHMTLVVNVPTWFLAFNALNLRFIAQKGNNRFIFVKPSKVTETLLKYATIENILVQYGGLKRENETEFFTEDKILEADIRANSTGQIKIPASEVETTVTWDVTVVGYEVTCREKFIPDDDCSYKVLTKKKAFYRYKSSPVVSAYTYTKS